ncbi:ferritin [Candidatus Woesearchaeota archaeon]|nr:ferritin [Candidatus Woesearchaeota archaeon]
MKIKKKMQDALNEQINKEMESAYIYLAMAAYFDKENLTGMSHWMKKQAQEEVDHAMRIYRYVFERAGNVKLKAIKKPEHDWSNPLEVFEAAYEHEKFITDSINQLVDLSEELDDKPTGTFLNWFIDEQVEEEDSALGIVEKLRMIGDAKPALMMLDRVLGKRE